MAEQRYLTSDEAGEILGCSPRTVQRLAEQGDLPFEDKLPGRTGPYLFSRSVVELVAKNREERRNRVRKGAGGGPADS